MDAGPRRLRPTTSQTLIADGSDRETGRAPSAYAAVGLGPGEPHVVREDLGRLDASGPVPADVALLHVTDTHVMDAASPARSEWIEQLAGDPRWRPLLHMARPHDLTVNHAVAELAVAIATGGVDIDAVVMTGDNIDNAQRNELDAELAILDGGRLHLPYTGGPQDHVWADHLRADDWAFWTPEDARPDRFSLRGFPKVKGLLRAVNEPVRCHGIGLPWFVVYGNHDAMRQGTVYSDDAIERIAVGSRKMIGAPPGLMPSDPLADYLAGAHRYSEGGAALPITADAARRAVGRAEFAAAHRGHGMGSVRGDSLDYDVALADGWRLVVLDTVHHVGHYAGSVSAEQLTWLADRLDESRASGELVVMASHHGPATLDNRYGSPADNAGRRLAADALEVVHRSGIVPVWLVGHRHVHEVVAHRDPAGRTPGVWEVTTSSIIDWPCQSRAVELGRSGERRAAIRSTVLDHGDHVWFDRREGWIASLHRELAMNVANGTGVRRDPRGRREDRNVVLGWGA